LADLLIWSGHFDTRHIGQTILFVKLNRPPSLGLGIKPRPVWRLRHRGSSMDDFLKVIETDMKPRVFALAPVDRGNQTLFGHSFGGLTVLEALFREPGAFRTFVAASPSISPTAPSSPTGSRYPLSGLRWAARFHPPFRSRRHPL